MIVLIKSGLSNANGEIGEIDLITQELQSWVL